jgi:hypothetical protein
MQKGAVGASCLERPDEEVHLWENEVALITRPVVRPDGVTVDAFLWTTLLPSARSVFINVENDDYGNIVRDTAACTCPLGRVGLNTIVSGIRGVSKVVAGGVTVPGEVLARLAEEELPAALGGSPAHYQFGEEERDGQSGLVLRIDPAVAVDEAKAVAVVRERLRQTEVGLLADEVWGATGALRIERVAPHATKSGKVLTFEGFTPPQ